MYLVNLFDYCLCDFDLGQMNIVSCLYIYCILRIIIVIMADSEETPVTTEGLLNALTVQLAKMMRQMAEIKTDVKTHADSAAGRFVE